MLRILVLIRENFNTDIAWVNIFSLSLSLSLSLYIYIYIYILKDYPDTVWRVVWGEVRVVMGTQIGDSCNSSDSKSWYLILGWWQWKWIAENEWEIYELIFTELDNLDIVSMEELLRVAPIWLAELVGGGAIHGIRELYEKTRYG